MTTFEIILYVIVAIVSAAATAVPCILKLISAIKKWKAAKTEADKAAAIADMKVQMKTFIQAAEIAYAEVNTALKAKGMSAGPVRKDSVMMKLQSYATEHGYKFEPEYWSAEIDEEVNFTKQVNK